jgi:peptidoglycan/LPS O-acetylase OafA/YrhL
LRKNLVRFHQIDGFRAVAILLVIFHHGLNLALRTLLEKLGFLYLSKFCQFFFGSGVDLFFIISGVVLLRPYLRRERRFETKKYFRRRIERLWPPYLVALFLSGLVVLVTTNFPNWYSRGHLPKFSLWNWLSQLFIIYSGNVPYNAAWWSLNIEIIFYILVPLIIPLLLLCNKKYYLYGLLFTLVIFSEFAYYNIHSEANNNIKLVLLFISYFPCFLLASMLAYNDFSWKYGLFASMLGLLYTVTCLVIPLNIHNGYGLFYFGLVVMSFYKGGYLNRFLQTYPILWIGERSYSLFLIHFTLFYLVDYIVSFFILSKNAYYFIWTRLLGIPAAFLVAMLIFFYVERYFARGLNTADYFWPFFKKGSVINN